MREKQDYDGSVYLAGYFTVALFIIIMVGAVIVLLLYR
jgi:hypothetical protein